MNKKKYILIFLSFVLTLLVSVGMATWIIINQNTGAPNVFTPSSSQKITPTIATAPTLSEIYEGEQADISGGVAKVGFDPIKGSFTCNTKTYTFNPNGSSSNKYTQSATYTFTPEDNSKYNPVTFTKENALTIKAIAYNGSTFYGTVENAIKKSNSGTVYVIPYPAGEEKALSDVARTIKSNTEIKSGVTVTLPYSGTTYANREGSPSSQNVLADSVSSYLQNDVFINGNVTLTNNGRLNIGGILGDTGTILSGHTSGNYAQITMNSNSNIVNNGTIDCYGFIKESQKNNGSLLTSNSGTIYMPFVIYDYGGGTHTTGSYRSGGISPFTQYDLPNIQCAIKNFANSTIIGYADLYTGAYSLGSVQIIGARHNTTDVRIISSSNAVINLTQGGAENYTLSKFNAETATNTSKEGTTDIAVYGNASFGSMSLTVSVAFITDTVETSELFFPVSWKINISLINGTHNIPNKIKFLPGSSLTVEENTTLNAGSELIFYPSDYEDNVGRPYPYPSGKGEATFTVNGTVNITNSFGGKIYTKSANAVLNYNTDLNSVSSYECEGTGPDEHNEADAKYVDANALADITDGTTLSENELLTRNVYSSTGSAWQIVENPQYYTINYNANQGTLTSAESNQFLIPAGSTSITISAISATAPTRQYYTFTGWYIDKACQQHISDYPQTLSSGESITVYAGWELTNYVIEYMVVDDDGNYITLPSATQTFNYQNIPTLLTQGNVPGYEDFTLVGWYVTPDRTGEQISSINTAFLEHFANGKLTLYGNVTKSYIVSFVSSQYGLTADKQYVKEGGSISLPDWTMYDDAIEKQFYFNGWLYTYTDANGTTHTNTNIAPNGVYSDVTVTADWASKVEIQIHTYKAKVTVNNQEFTGDDNIGSIYGKDGDIINFTITYTGNSYKYAGIVAYNSKPSGSSGLTKGATSLSLTIDEDSTDDGKRKIYATSGQTCIVEGTLITLADGSQKKVEDLTSDDELLIFNHKTGEYEAGKLWFNVHHDQEPTMHTIVNLKFSDGTLLRIVGEHGLFDLTVNKYVFLTASNAHEYIGHEFFTSERSSITLTEVYIIEEVVRIFSPVSVKHLNCVTESLLSVSTLLYNSSGLVNMFEFDENLKYDEEMMQADIEKYGLFTYENWSEYVSEEVFNSTPAQYWKVAIGKGLINYEDIVGIIKFLYENELIE